MKMEGVKSVMVVAELDWSGLHCQSHYMAKRFAEEGYKVVYVNRTLQRWPKWRHLASRLGSLPFFRKKTRGYSRPVPKGLKVVTPWVGPPFSWLRPLNRRLLRRYFKGRIEDSILISYLPTYNCIDIASIIEPKSIYYLCYHNFDADVVLPDVIKSERELIGRSRLLFADSRFLVSRLERTSGRSDVIHAPPGVHYGQFTSANRGDEHISPKKICFFGGAGKHLDLDVYNLLAEYYEVHFVANISEEIIGLLSPKIHVASPVGHSELPAVLKEMDVLSILYRQSDYIDGVIPAKFYECLATGKPLLVSGLKELLPFGDVVYDTENDPEKAITILSSLSVTFPSRIGKQLKTASEADYENRYISFRDHIAKSLIENKKG